MRKKQKEIAGRKQSKYMELLRIEEEKQEKIGP